MIYGNSGDTLELQRIISGGQTGVDRAALDVAREFGLARGGWCPRGRKAEDGPIPTVYPLDETKSAKYAVRTRWNVRDADATLILTTGPPSGGTELTQTIAEQLGRLHLVIDLNQPTNAVPVACWLKSHRIMILNVAGPRESTSPGIYNRARDFLREVLRQR